VRLVVDSVTRHVVDERRLAFLGEARLVRIDGYARSPCHVGGPEFQRKGAKTAPARTSDEQTPLSTQKIHTTTDKPLAATENDGSRLSGAT